MRALLRVQMLNALRSMKEGMGIGKSKWSLLLIPLMILGFAPILLLLTAMFFGFYMSGRALGYPELVLTVALTTGQLVCLTFGIFYVISSFYFSKDITMLIPMPLRPGEIVLSKFISIMIGEYLTMLPVVLPAVAIYGIFSDVSWTFLPFALVIFLLLPVPPLVLSSLFSIVLMRVTNLRRNRDLWRVLGGLIGLGFGLGINYFVRIGTRSGNFNPQSGQMVELTGQMRQMFESLSKYFPTTAWATNALREGAPAFGFGSFVLFVAISLAALAGMVWVAETLFYGGAVGGDETRTSGRKLTRTELAKETAQTRTPVWAMFIKEFKLLNRTPSFLMQALVPLIVMPFFVIMPMLQEKEIGKLMSQVAANSSSPLVPAIGLGIVLFMSSMSGLSATAISREGKHFWISRSLPVAPRTQVHAKLLHSMVFTVINVVMVLGVLAYFKVLLPLTFLYVLIGGLLAGGAMGYGGLIVDLLRPNLKWTDPQQAMKGNYNVLFGMLFIWLMMGIVAIVTWLLYKFAPILIMPGIILIFALETFLFGKAAGALADKRYVEIED